MARQKGWRVEQTRIHRPNVLLAAAIFAVFIAAGVVMWLLLAGAAVHGVPEAVGVLLRNALPAGFVGMGLVGLAAVVRDAIRRRRPLWAADATVLPDVPTEPVNDTRRIAHDHVRHQIESNDHGWSLVPRHRDINRTSLIVTAWIGLTVVGATTLLWLLEPGERQGQKIAMTAVSVIAGISMTAIVWFATWDSKHRARRIDVDFEQRTIQFDGERTVLLEDVVAIQICPLRIKIPPTPAAGRRWGHDGDTLEVNAVLRDAARQLDRETLYIVGADFPGAGELAAELAERLDVPLLNHATAEHWPAEIGRAKERAWTFHGSAP